MERISLSLTANLLMAFSKQVPMQFLILLQFLYVELYNVDENCCMLYF